MAKLADRSWILIETANSLLTRVYNTKALLAYDKTRPSIFDAQFAKLVGGITKKFPEPPGSEIEKLQGYDTLSARSKQHMEELEPHYMTFVDLLEFKELTLSLLNDFANGVQDYRMEENPNVTSGFLELCTLYVRLLLLLSTIEQRKIVASTYHRAYFISKCSNEPNYTKVATFINKFENPFKEIENEFRNVAPKLGKALSNLTMTYMKARDVSVMRKEGIHNITLKPEKLALPIKDPFHQQVEYAPRMFLWIVYGYYFCQDELNKTVDLLKFAMAEGFNIPVFRDVTYSINSDYETLISNSKIKTLKKKKKEIIEASASAITGSGLKHRQRRIYLRQELGSLLHLLCDKPGLLGPKFQVVLSALALAKDEVFWYYRHTNARQTTKKYNPEDYKDSKMPELLSLILQMTELIFKHKKLVQTYYLEYLKGADYQSARQAVTSEFSGAVGNVANAVESLLNELASINTSNTEYSFKVFRLNWARIESVISCSPAFNLPKTKDVLSKFTYIVAHTKNVDSLDTLIDDYASLKALYYFRDSVMQTFTQSITDVVQNQPMHSMAFMKLAALFPDNVTAFLPEEREVVGNESANMATQILDKITTTIVSNLQEIVKNYTSFDNQILDVNAAYPLLQKQKDYKPDKNFVPPATPGSESVHKNRVQLENLRLVEKTIYQLCTSMNEFVSITVYDTFFTPREFLKEALSRSFVQFVKKVAIIDAENIQRPTVILRLIEVFCNVLALVESFVDLDIGALMREAFIGQTYARGLEFNGKYDWVWENDDPPDPNPDNIPLVRHIAVWYGSFVPKKLALPGICYSPVRKGFVSEGTTPFKAEYFADIVELRALASLIGPYGFKLIHRELYKFLAANFATLKEILSTNRPALDELSKNYHREATCTETLRKLKDVDVFVQKSVAVGNTLILRDLLSESLASCLEESVPYIYNTINTCFHQYDRNIFMVPELLPVDSLAAEAGIDVGTADQAIKSCIVKSIGNQDPTLWNLIPYLYAASFTSLSWKDAEFRPILESHSNNLHALVKTIISFIVGTKSLQLTPQGEKEIIVLLQKFIEVSSVILLRMSRIDPKSEKKPPRDFPSIIIFMDLFMQECPVLTRDVLEASLPNGLLRSMYKEIYKPKLLKKKEVDSQNPQEI